MLKIQFSQCCLLLVVFMLLSCKPTAEPEGDSPLIGAGTIGVEKEWMLSGFEKVDSLNPILRPSEELTFVDPVSGNAVQWEMRNVLNPAAVVKDDQVYLFYRAQDRTGTSRIGLAVSDDGLRFEKRPAPVFFPERDSLQKYEWNYKKYPDFTGEKNAEEDLFDGVEDPRIVQREDGTYIMTYTAYNGKTARLCVASSQDLVTWKKHGPAFTKEKYVDARSKSGAIVSRQEGSAIIATKIAGKYWMYYGDTDIFLATSEDGIRWEVAENAESQKRISVLHPRMAYFDSRLVEPGPYALLRDEGILLIYNGSNAKNFNDPQLPIYTYSAGQALFDKAKPFRLIDRTKSYFITPDKAYERVGEVNEVCFVEGLVYFKNKWFLYYGTADSKIAVAIKS